VELIYRHVCSSENLPADALAQLQAARREASDAQRVLTQSYEARDAASARANEAERKYASMSATVAALRREHEQAQVAVKEVKLREEIWRSKLEKERDRRDALLDEQRYWHQREQKLSESFLKLEDEYGGVVQALHAERKGGRAVSCA
jgi:predicted  nucleic acid-binding Zn-ribbon protein